jgi:molecular chaperone HtpG
MRGSGLPRQPVLEINPEHPLMRQLQSEDNGPRLAEWTHVLYNQAVLTLGARVDEPAAFVRRLNDLLVALTRPAAPADAADPEADEAPSEPADAADAAEPAEPAEPAAESAAEPVADQD